MDYFVYFMSQMDVYEGSLPTLGYTAAIVYYSSDVGKPLSMIRTGRLDTSVTKEYYKYYGNEAIYQYTTTYDDSLANKTRNVYKNPWRSNVTITGGDGGVYGTQISSDDILPVFVSTILRCANLKYVEDKTYHGLDVLYFEVEKGTVNSSATVPKNEIYYQDPKGYDGFFNMSMAYGAPAFIGFHHCYMCSNEAQQMFNYYEYSETGENHMGKLVAKPTSDDAPYGNIEPLTGTGIDVYLNFEIRFGIYNDYFFKNFYEPAPGKGVYIPTFMLQREFHLTSSQVDDYFGSLKLIQKLRKILFYIGVLVGCGFIVFALIVGIFMYRRNKFGSWKTRRNTTVDKYMSLADQGRKKQKRGPKEMAN